MKKKRTLLGVMVILFVVTTVFCGCESVRRKFTRTKKGKGAEETVILEPRDYSEHPFSNDVLYKQHFVYWKAWNQELVTSLNDLAPAKKVKDCMTQTIVNLEKMATYLQEDKAKELGVYIKNAHDLSQRVDAAETMPWAQKKDLRYDAERLLSNVNRKFDLTKMRSHLLK